MATLPTTKTQESPTSTQPPADPPLTATITADSSEDWPSQQQPTVVASGGDGVYSYSVKLYSDGIDESARLSATNIANPTYTPRLRRQHVTEFTITDDSGQSITKVHTHTVGDAEGWFTLDPSGGTLHDTFSQVVSRDSSGFTIDDVNAGGIGANWSGAYFEITDLLPPEFENLATRFIMDAGMYGAGLAGYGSCVITTTPTNLSSSSVQFGGGTGRPSNTWQVRIVGNSAPGNFVSTAYGTHATLPLDSDGVSFNQAAYHSVNSDGTRHGSNATGSVAAKDFAGAANLYAMCEAHSASVETVADKPVTGTWQIRVS